MYATRPGNARVHQAAARTDASPRARDRRLRGVHPALSRVVGRSPTSAGCLDRADRDDLRRPRRQRRLEHLVALVGDARTPWWEAARHRRFHGLLDLPAPRQFTAELEPTTTLPGSERAGDAGPLLRSSRTRGIASPPPAAGALPRLRRHARARSTARSARALGQPPPDDRRRGVGLDRRHSSGPFDHS